MNNPSHLKYTKDHEWVSLDGKIATIGITNYAVAQLGDIVYLDLPQENSEFNQGDSLGTIESTKTVSDIYTPLKGRITEVNNSIRDQPETIAKDPYQSGWILKIEIDISEISELMTCAEYEKYISAN